MNHAEKPVVYKMDLEHEFYTSEGCHITELSNTELDLDVSIARARIETGITTRWHKLSGTTERYCIIAGTGLVEVGDSLAEEVSTGDVVVIPPGCRQRIRNIGMDDLIFLAICSPRFEQHNYHEIGHEIGDDED